MEIATMKDASIGLRDTLLVKPLLSR